MSLQQARRTFRRVFSIPVALAGLAVVGTPDVASARALKKTVVQHNIEKNQNAMDAAVSKALMNSAMGVTLQEVCASQLFNYLMPAHPNWSFGAAQHNVGTTNCPNGEANYNVVVWTGGLTGSYWNVQFGVSGGVTPGRDGSIACLFFTENQQPIALCSTHLWAGTGQDDGLGLTAREAQVAQIKGLANGWIGMGYSVIVGGDFNSPPTTSPMNGMYDPAIGSGGTGRFADFNRNGANNRNGQATSDSGRQIDYVFYSTNRTATGLTNTSVSIAPDGSDHHIVVASAQVTVSP